MKKATKATKATPVITPAMTIEIATKLAKGLKRVQKTKSRFHWYSMHQLKRGLLRRIFQHVILFWHSGKL
jgi:hypothetical protein